MYSFSALNVMWLDLSPGLPAAIFLMSSCAKKGCRTSCWLPRVSNKSKHAGFWQGGEKDGFFFHSKLLRFVEDDNVASGEEVSKMWVEIEVSGRKP